MDDAAAFVATWSLEEWTAATADGTIIEPLGPNPIGLVTYDAAGRMATHVGRRWTRAPSAPDAPHDDPGAPAPAGEFVAYMGRYQVAADEGVVHHHVEMASIPAWVGSVQTRFYELDGDRLTLSTASMVVTGGQEAVHVLHWRRR